jgi:peptide/nickel transport system permease protein
MRYIAGRLLQSLATLFLFMVVIFVATRAAGAPAMLLMPPDASPEEIAAAQHRFGTDRPYHEQFAVFIRDMMTFDFGRSVVYREPVTQLIGGRVLASLGLGFTAIALVLMTAVPLGVLAATRRGRAADHAVRALAYLGVSTGMSAPFTTRKHRKP